MSNLSIIVAMSSNRAIGLDNALPWHLSADLKRFKKTTMGKPIVMGRKTWQSLGRALPGRANIVLTRDAYFKSEGAQIYHSLEQVLLAQAAEDEIMIIGGHAIYQEALPLTTTIYQTLIHQYYEGDTFFPELDLSEWEEVEREDYQQDAGNPDYSFVKLVRRS